MSETILQLNEGVIHSELKELVKNSIEETEYSVVAEPLIPKN